MSYKLYCRRIQHNLYLGDGKPPASHKVKYTPAEYSKTYTKELAIATIDEVFSKYPKIVDIIIMPTKLAYCYNVNTYIKSNPQDVYYRDK